MWSALSQSGRNRTKVSPVGARIWPMCFFFDSDIYPFEVLLLSGPRNSNNVPLAGGMSVRYWSNTARLLCVDVVQLLQLRITCAGLGLLSHLLKRYVLPLPYCFNNIKPSASVTVVAWNSCEGLLPRYVNLEIVVLCSYFIPIYIAPKNESWWKWFETVTRCYRTSNTRIKTGRREKMWQVIVDDFSRE